MAIVASVHCTFCKKRKDMCYLTTHSTHFILWLYGVGHVVKDQSAREKTRCRFPFSSKGFCYMYHPSYKIAHTTASVIPVVEHCRELEIAPRLQREG